jgi:hypothetical protein
MQELFLDRGVEALADGVVETVAAGAHRDVDAGEPAALTEHERRKLCGFKWLSQRSVEKRLRWAGGFRRGSVLVGR